MAARLGEVSHLRETPHPTPIGATFSRKGRRGPAHPNAAAGGGVRSTAMAIAEIRSSGLTGLPRCSSKPSFRKRSRSPAVAEAVRAITGVSAAPAAPERISDSA
ncbi:conserved hypothetical protein, partial [Ricinus communis]